MRRAKKVHNLKEKKRGKKRKREGDYACVSQFFSSIAQPDVLTMFTMKDVLL